MPIEMRANITKIKYGAHPYGGNAIGWYSPADKEIGLSPNYTLSKDTFLHEMMHGLLYDKIDDGDYQFLLDMYEVEINKILSIKIL